MSSGIIPNPSFTETNMYEAIKKVYYENPAALIQVRNTIFNKIY